MNSADTTYPLAGVAYDYGLYPDRAPPNLDAPDCPEYERADYLARLCAALDYGLMPTLDMMAALDAPLWHEIIIRYPLPGSPWYHALRWRHRLPEIPHPPYVDLRIGASNLPRRDDWRQDPITI